MTLTTTLDMILFAALALPVTAVAILMWNAIQTTGLGDVFPDEGLLKAIGGSGDANPWEQRPWT